MSDIIKLDAKNVFSFCGANAEFKKANGSTFVTPTKVTNVNASGDFVIVTTESGVVYIVDK